MGQYHMGLALFVVQKDGKLTWLPVRLVDYMAHVKDIRLFPVEYSLQDDTYQHFLTL